ncbi:MAG: hypothetical protein ACJA2C_000423 [Marinoscillum sp.]|jgi:hypothetical protein
MDSNQIIGAVTDLNGDFKILNMTLRRCNILARSTGYEEQVIPSILLTAAKEVILNISMVESIENLDAVEVTATNKRGEVLNEMALISACSFSVEETLRYAGSFNDPARMVSAFAGVSANAEGDNDIVVRGNSPKGILWRLEGVEIPNPNHFADEGSTGGPVNALNSNMLYNSDFYTGAFAPEFCNAPSGVLDLKRVTMKPKNTPHQRVFFGWTLQPKAPLKRVIEDRILPIIDTVHYNYWTILDLWILVGCQNIKMYPLM